ncbi:TetR/AcrR family transcriptional regulator [Dyadobacter sp. CY345]|uniref:TetR/AcrR family transcriptional regulator n=1 Tax=Dyadobacter sp. CY345 TaxID=2909335 RepID=UPI001F2DBC21|nr:TetR/AcrR family transcriptional regulator [Dyadobacter sp. CY345]MCF2447440.1 TetR/AcrR family transcriptional regulator [Dyadobacter sp. CY345]
MSNKDEIIKAKILEGADKLFQRYGLNKTTMEDIAKDAGKGKSTLYYYFKSKEEIFDAIIGREKDEFFQMLKGEISKAPTALEKFKTFYVKRFEMMKKMANLYTVLVSETRDAMFSVGGDCTWRKKYDEKEMIILKSILEYGMISGEFRILSENELEKLAFVLASAQRGIEFDLLMYDKLEEMHDYLSLLMELIMNGIKKS